MRPAQLPLWPIVSLLFVSLYAGGCSTTETVSNFLSSTSDWYGPDGLPRAERRVDMFVTLSLDNLKSDMARGEGEYLTSLQSLLAISPGRRVEFGSLVQKNYSLLAGQETADIARLLTDWSLPLR